MRRRVAAKKTLPQGAHGFRFFFFSHEEPHLHVHVNHAEGEAKFWMEPQIAFAQNIGLSGKALKQAQALI